MGLRRFIIPLEVTEEDLSMGKAAPLPTNEKRRRADAPGAPIWPFWEEGKGDKSLVDAAATEKRLVSNVYQSQSERGA